MDRKTIIREVVIPTLIVLGFIAVLALGSTVAPY